MRNPFTGWKKQCTHVFFKDKNGKPIWHLDGKTPKELKIHSYCAAGWLILHLEESLMKEFHLWLKNKTGKTTSDLNDVSKWTPDQFRQAWRDFVKETKCQ